MQREKRYSWCFSKEKNIDAAWEMAWELGHSDVHHYTLLQHSVQQRKAWLRPSAPTSTSAAWWVATATPLISGCSSAYLPTPTPDRCSTSSDIIFWRRGSSAWERTRTKFRKLSSGRERMKVIKEIH